MLTMKKADYEKILSHAKENLPEEAAVSSPEPKTGTRRQSRKYIYWRMSIIPMSIFP